MVKLMMLCGKVGSGKTTYAKELEIKEKAITLSVDEWVINFYGKDIPCTVLQEKVEMVKEQIYIEALKILNKDIPIILDFGFWTKKERIEVRKIFEDFIVETHYINLEEELILEQLKKRNKLNLPEDYQINEETFRRLSDRFEAPADEENVILVHTVKKLSSY